MAEIEFTLNTETGELELRIKGIPGHACEDITTIAEELLGAPAQERKTAEYYIRARVKPQSRSTSRR